ncbi:MAG: cysteine synthase A [Oscillospiraceae bacterium]|nr:cysteine synthase A [Oscillospiraceae bacterium]
MAKIYTSVEQLIGHTPLLQLTHLQEKLGLKARVLAKLERFNPGGSSKDRVAVAMLDDAEKRGILREGATIIEPTSGNTGIGLACVAAARGYKATIVMPDSMSAERQILMKAYGAQLVLTDGAKGMAGAIEKAKELAETTPNSFLPSQFENPANAMAHEKTTGPEIWQDTDGNVDVFVAGVGTGGTITGTGRYLKGKNADICVIAVEPQNSAVLSGKKAGAHGLQGIGAGFIPDVLDTNIYDEIVTVSDEQAYEASRMLGRCEGIVCGISSGAALHAAIEQAKREENVGKTIVVLLPDTGERYLSTELYRE